MFRIDGIDAPAKTGRTQIGIDRAAERRSIRTRADHRQRPRLESPAQPENRHLGTSSDQPSVSLIKINEL
jgi:hypothetical protein